MNYHKDKLSTNMYVNTFFIISILINIILINYLVKIIIFYLSQLLTIFSVHDII